MKKTILSNLPGLMRTSALAMMAMSVCGNVNAQSIDYGSLQQLFNEPVTTSATGSPQRSTEVPVDMTIISAEEITHSGATDLPTILSRVAGVDVLNFAASQSDVGIRGYNQARSPRLLVLINGRQVYLDHFGYTDWNSLPVQLGEIRQIEVVRGPNSAIFGFNAVSGVINIITYNPKFDNTNVVEVLGGTQDYRSLSLIKTLRLGDRFAMRLSASGEAQNEWENHSPSVTTAMIKDPSTVHANLDATLQLAPKAVVRFEASSSNAQGTQVISTFAYAAHKVKTNSMKVALNWETTLGMIQAQAYKNSLDAVTPGRQYLNDITVVSLEDLFKLGTKHTFRVGLEYRDNQLDTASYAGAKIAYKVWAPSIMWNWAISEKLSLTAAARQDQLTLERTGTFPTGAPQATNALWDRDINETSVNLGAVYKATDQDSIRATYARGVQAPTLLELGGLLIPPATAAPTGALITGNPFLEPAIVSNYELAYDRDIPSVNTKAGIKVFAQKTDDVKGQFTTAAPDIAATTTTWATYTYKNASNSKMNGLEVFAKGKLKSGLKWSADSTFTDVKDAPYTTVSALTLRKVNFEATTPKFRGNVALGWANEKWSIDSFVHYISKFNSYNGNALEPVEGYATLAGRVAYSFKDGMSLALNGQNLMEEFQSQAKGPSGLQAERKVTVSLRKSW